MEKAKPALTDAANCMREGGIQTKNTTGGMASPRARKSNQREAVSQQPYGSTGVFPAQEQTASFRLIRAGLKSKHQAISGLEHSLLVSSSFPVALRYTRAPQEV